MTKQFILGVLPPIRESGDIADTPGCTLEKPAGSTKLDRSVVCVMGHHIHMTPTDALEHGVCGKCVVRVRIAGDRELVDALVRVPNSLSRCMSTWATEMPRISNLGRRDSSRQSKRRPE